MRHITQEDINNHVTRYHTRFSTEVFLRRPTFFMSNDDLESKMNPIKEWVHIGEGTSGKVFKAKWLGVDVAVKMSDDIMSENPILEDFIINSNIRHPNIVNFFVASPNLIVMELMTNGTLDEILVKQKSRKPDMDLRKRWCSQVAMAVNYLHESGIVHSDIKPENILIGSSWEAKIGDVGGGYFVNDEVKDKIYTDMFLPLTLHTRKEKMINIGKVTDLYSLVMVMLCILSWNADIFSLLGIPNFERRISESVVSREETIKDCLETCVPIVYNLIQSYDLTNDAKSFMFKMFSDPCKSHVTNEPILDVIERNDDGCKDLYMNCLANM